MLVILREIVTVVFDNPFADLYYAEPKKKQ